MNFNDLMLKDISTLSKDDFTCSWHVMHNTAVDKNGNILGEAYCACYSPDYLPDMTDFETAKQTYEDLQNCENYRYAKKNGWLEMSAYEKSMKSRGVLDPIQGDSLLAVNTALTSRGFSPCKQSDVIEKTIAVS